MRSRAWRPRLKGKAHQPRDQRYLLSMELSGADPFDGVIGHTQALDQLRSQLRKDRLAHAYLFVGEAGLGKSTAARALASALLPEASLTRHPDYWEDDRIKPLSINEIRLLPDKPPEFHELSLQAFLNLKPAVGMRSVALVVNVQPVHLEKLGSLEAIRREKVSIALGLPRDGVLVLPAGITAPEWKGKVVRFGDGTAVREVTHAPHGESWQVVAEIAKKEIAFSLTPGAPHRVQNALAALASVHAAKLDVYFNAGGEFVGRHYQFNSAGKTVGYGSPTANNLGCYTEAPPPSTITSGTVPVQSNGFLPSNPANCTANTRNVIEGTAGFWYRFYKGPKGTIQVGPQYSYFMRNAWEACGTSALTGPCVNSHLTAPHGNENIFETSFRYYLP